MLEYDEGTSMTLHTHDHNEDFVIFIYLNDCNDSQTVFYLNDKKYSYIQINSFLNETCVSSLVKDKEKITSLTEEINTEVEHFIDFLK